MGPKLPAGSAGANALFVGGIECLSVVIYLKP